ncbi:MAG TPA: pentapeptide repeat-containing protein [Gammaproteobacteria bacterium]|nr:pentapeptide repeat-containing protein [Gammaproteobacteria bacterium]
MTNVIKNILRKLFKRPLVLRADLHGSDLHGANLCGADLRWANLKGVNFRGTKLCGADLRHANLEDADLRGADLRGANLYGAKLCGANLKQTGIIFINGVRGNAILFESKIHMGDKTFTFEEAKTLRGYDLDSDDDRRFFNEYADDIINGIDELEKR